MIAKITTGSSFRGALDYLMKAKREKPEQEGQEGRSVTGRRERFPEYFGIEGEGYAPPFAKGERHRLIGGNMGGQTARDLAREFGLIIRHRPSILKPVHHVSLSAAPGERLRIEQWRGIAEKYIEGMDFSNALYVVIQHRDAEQDHIHILASRVDVYGQVVKDSHEKRRAQKIMREVERVARGSAARAGRDPG